MRVPIGITKLVACTAVGTVPLDTRGASDVREVGDGAECGPLALEAVNAVGAGDGAHAGGGDVIFGVVGDGDGAGLAFVGDCGCGG